MKMTFVSEANKLKNIQINLEKSEQILFEHLRKHGETKIVEFNQVLEMERFCNIYNAHHNFLESTSILQETRIK